MPCRATNTECNITGHIIVSLKEKTTTPPSNTHSKMEKTSEQNWPKHC